MALPKYQKAAAAPKAEAKKRTEAAAAPKGKAEPKKRARGAASRPDAAGAAPAAPREASVGPPAKRVRDAGGAAVAAKVAAIAGALKGAQGLPVGVREMLAAGLPECCSMVGPFHPFQEKILRMLNEAFMGIETQRLRELQQSTASASQTRDELDRQQKAHENATASLAATSACVNVKEAACAESDRALKSCKATFEDLQVELQRGDAVLGGVVMEAEQLRSVLAQISESGLCTESSLETLRELTPAPSDLDDMAKLEGELSQRIAALNESVSTKALARIEQSAQLKAAQASLDAAAEKHKTCADALARAQAEKHERASAVKTLTRTRKQQKVIVAQAIERFHAAQKLLLDFQRKALGPLKTIISEVEQRHGVCINASSEEAAAKAEQASTIPASEPLVAEPGVVHSAPIMRHEKTSIPVIDRRQHQAVLRRRSAALPMGSFARLSLMARRSSLAGRGLLDIDADDNADDIVAHKEVSSVRGGSVRNPDGSGAFDGVQSVPTPNRNVIGPRPH